MPTRVPHGWCSLALLAIACGEPSTPVDPDDAGIERDAGGPTDRDAGPPDVVPQRAPIFGVTVTDPWVAEQDTVLVDGLATLVGSTGRLPTVRVVFDEHVDRLFLRDGDDASAYVPSVTAIGARARVMGELLDSFYMTQYSIDQLRARACEYRAALGHLVDVWEIGNEVNGEWLGADVDVEAKLLAVFDVFHADRATFEGTLCSGFTLSASERPFELALTLYYNGEHDGGVASASNCWDQPENAMLYWAASRLGAGGALARMTPELDYVLVSYYEDDCNDLQPSWQRVFDELGAIVPDASLGIGECGTVDTTQKPLYAERYYHGIDSTAPELLNMRVDHPRFVGGYFWWWFSDDLANPSLVGALQAALDRPFWDR